ncbi:hypothetical protein [Mucilaginibacter aquariorum]|uniref:Uncharacterized protein n=1 Tax=Mucilaginibacter aquariorum TaxID=2967225 RepID=A0ABT1T5N8_9SPHI|nr:hypothetical protein [Mucilaginibacter aquariorum]MCQ6959556.1 hypothetical protein [Mucilaginibacter aquariorum]
MEERKTAAIVLGTIALIVIFFAVILPKARHSGTQTISFRQCTVNFVYGNEGVDSDIYSAAQNKLGLCLCNYYQQKPDTAVANRIIQIYSKYDNNYADSLHLFNNIDSIIKHKSNLLDTMILVE